MIKKEAIDPGTQVKASTNFLEQGDKAHEAMKLCNRVVHGFASFLDEHPEFGIAMSVIEDNVVFSHKSDNTKGEKE